MRARKLAKGRPPRGKSYLPCLIIDSVIDHDPISIFIDSFNIQLQERPGFPLIHLKGESVLLTRFIMAKTTLFLAAACVAGTHAFAPARVAQSGCLQTAHSRYNVSPLQESAEGNQEKNTEEVEEVAIELTAEEKEAVGNLVADEEWAGLSMELADVVRTAVVEDLKKNSRDFLGKDEYAIGDFSKEIDQRVKDEVAKMREKDDYELGDLSVVLDEKVKDLVCELSGKEEVSNIMYSCRQ